MFQELRRFREADGYECWDRWMAWPLVVLGLIFLVVLILPLAHPMTHTESQALSIANVVIWAAFAIDYLARVYLSRDRGLFVRTHVLDLIVVAVPFLRPFRLLRLFAIVASTSRRAGGLVVRRITIYVIAVTLIVMTCSAVVVYDAEQSDPAANIHTLGDALWWAVTTVTTVGYGDRYPVTDIGRLMATGLMFTGIALVGVITAAVAAWFVNIVRQSSTAAAEEHSAQHEDSTIQQLAKLTATVEALRLEISELRQSSAN